MTSTLTNDLNRILTQSSPNIQTLRNVLMRFSVVYLTHNKPSNICEFGIQFFKELKSNQKLKELKKKFSQSTDSSLEEMAITPNQSYEDREEEDDENAIDTRAAEYRRASVVAQPIDPANDIWGFEQDQLALFPKTEEERNLIKSSLKKLIFFKFMDNDQLDRLMNAMFQRKLVENEMVVQQGSDGDYFYIVQSGQCALLSGDDKRTLTKGMTFGETALVHNIRRSGTVRAETEAQVWAIDRHSYHRIISQNVYKKRKLYENMLLNVPILQHLSNVERSKLADAFKTKKYPKGTEIFHKGNIADGIHFIIKGSVWLRSDILSDPNEKAEIHGKNDFIGALSLLDDVVRYHTAIAIEDVQTAFLDKDAFVRLLGPCSDIIKRGLEDSRYQSDIYRTSRRLQSVLEILN